MEGSLLSQGFELMLIGMGTVFIFLTLLVFTTRAMSAIAMRLQPIRAAMPASPQAGQDAEVVAAIAGALELHRAARQSTDRG